MTTLYKALENELDEIDETGENKLEYYLNGIEKVKDYLKELKVTRDKQKFNNNSDEIHYYKSIVPSFYKFLIYYVETYNREKSAQVIPASHLVEYYQEELNAIERFFKQNTFIYQYYLLKANDLDELYFLAKLPVKSFLVPEVPDMGSYYGTNASFFFAKIMAHEMLRDYIQNKLIELKHLVNNPASNITNKMVWTGESINLVEIAYGLWLTGQLNNGNASLNQIFYWLEKNLHIYIGKPQRRFVEIERRKRLSQTNFLDQMRNALITKIHDAYES